MSRYDIFSNNPTPTTSEPDDDERADLGRASALDLGPKAPRKLVKPASWSPNTVHALAKRERRFRNAKEAREAFGLDWTTSLQPIYMGRFAGPGPKENPTLNLDDPRVQKQYAVMRDDTGAVLGVVGSKFQPIQNDALDLLDEITHQAPIVRGGSFGGGRRVYLQTDHLEFDTPSGPAKGLGLAHLGHAGTHALTYSFGARIVVCQNTADMALRGAKRMVRIGHTKSAARRLEELQGVLTQAEDYYDKLSEVFGAMGRQTYTAAAHVELMEALFPKGEDGKRSTKAQNKLHAWEESFAGSPGVEGLDNSLWRAFMGTTHYATHKMGLKKGTDRFDSDLFGSGSKVREKAARVLVAQLVG